MRVCPKCGFVDPPEWRHSKYSYWIDFCDFDGFQKLHLALAYRLIKGEKIVEDEHYLYRMTKNRSKVERKAKVDYGEQWNVPMEKANRWSGTYPDFDKKWNVDREQKKLFEVAEK